MMITGTANQGLSLDKDMQRNREKNQCCFLTEAIENWCKDKVYKIEKEN